MTDEPCTSTPSILVEAIREDFPQDEQKEFLRGHAGMVFRQRVRITAIDFYPVAPAAQAHQPLKDQP